MLTISSIFRRGFLVAVKTTRPSNKSCGSDWPCIKFGVNNSLKSMYLPAWIWFTSLRGISEKPGPTTKCSSNNALRPDTLTDGKMVPGIRHTDVVVGVAALTDVNGGWRQRESREKTWCWHTLVISCQSRQTAPRWKKAVVSRVEPILSYRGWNAVHRTWSALCGWRARWDQRSSYTWQSCFGGCCLNCSS